ncbi:integrase catalytic region domain protein [Brucella pseudogrignonensis]|uniref:Integrase catalytic region domain protein n=1 Tax=Brucella pseudogrignonensis TaxID=419475 RepID=A0A256G6P9_9HYPH|nr:integrase catalytic region domain protein [Brucella pseudogrignonensis]
MRAFLQVPFGHDFLPASTRRFDAKTEASKAHYDERYPIDFTTDL